MKTYPPHPEFPYDRTAFSNHDQRRARADHCTESPKTPPRLPPLQTPLTGRTETDGNQKNIPSHGYQTIAILFLVKHRLCSQILYGEVWKQIFKVSNKI